MIDMDVLYTIYKDNMFAIHEYIQKFINISFSILKNAKDAIDKNDATLALDCFHQLKGSVGSIGFKKMYELCEAIEEKIAYSDWNAANELFAKLEKLLKNFQSKYEKESNSFMRK